MDLRLFTSIAANLNRLEYRMERKDGEFLFSTLALHLTTSQSYAYEKCTSFLCFFLFLSPSKQKCLLPWQLAYANQIHLYPMFFIVQLFSFDLWLHYAPHMFQSHSLFQAHFPVRNHLCVIEAHTCNQSVTRCVHFRIEKTVFKIVDNRYLSRLTPKVPIN